MLEGRVVDWGKSWRGRESFVLFRVQSLSPRLGGLQFSGSVYPDSHVALWMWCRSEVFSPPCM